MPLSLDEMVSVIRRYLDLEPQHYPMLLIFALSTRLKDLLPNDLCPYLSFIGSWSTGKSAASQFVTEICRGEWVYVATDAYILDAFDKAGNVKTIGIDQLDDQVERLDSLLSILEVGNRWTATYGMRVPAKGKGSRGKWESIRIPCGGPKVFNAIVPPRRTLSSRCYEIQMYPSTNERLSFQFKFRDSDVEAIASSLDWYASDIKSRFTPDDVKAHALSDEHIEKLRPLKRYSMRRVDIGNVFEMTNWMAGWNVDVITPLSYEVMDEEVEAFRSVLASIAIQREWVNDGPIPSQEVCSALNKRYREIGWEPYSPQAFGRRMVELGFTDHSGFRLHLNSGTAYIFSDDSMVLLRPDYLKRPVWGTAHLRRAHDE